MDKVLEFNPEIQQLFTRVLQHDPGTGLNKLVEIGFLLSQGDGALQQHLDDLHKEVNSLELLIENSSDVLQPIKRVKSQLPTDVNRKLTDEEEQMRKIACLLKQRIDFLQSKHSFH